MGEIERRFVRGAEVRLVEPDDGGPSRIVGHAAVFGQWSEDLGGFREKVRPGAFARTVREDDIRSLFNHDANYVLGRNRSGTLTLAEDETGLGIDTLPPDAQWARDLMVTIGRGDVSGMSFSFETIADEWTIRADGTVERELIEVRLWDVGPVTFPAYPQTTAQVRARVKTIRAEQERAAERPGDVPTQSVGTRSGDEQQPAGGQGPEAGAEAEAERQGRLARMRMRLETV